MLQIVEVVPVATAAFLGGRRAWYLACWGSGNFLAAQTGQRVDEKAAYEMGRSKIMQALANGFVSALRAANWAAIMGALQHVHHNAHESASIAWRGVIRDFRLAWEHSHDFVMRKHRKSANVRDLQLNLARAAVLAPADPHLATRVTSDQIISAQASVAMLVERGEKRTPDEIRELGDLRTIIKGWEDSHRAPQAFVSEPAKQGFMGALAAPGMVQGAAIAGGVILASWGVIAVDQLRIHSIKSDARANSDALKSYKLNYAAVTGRLDTLRQEVKAQNVRCEAETQAAADRRQAQDARTRRVQSEARRKLDAATSGSVAPFDLSARLRSLDAAPGAAPAGSAGAEGVASRVPGTGPAAAGAPGAAAAGQGDGGPAT